MHKIVFDPSSRRFSAEASGSGDMLRDMGRKGREAVRGIGTRIKDAVRRHVPSIMALGAVGGAFALSNGRRNGWGRAALERNKRKKAEGMASPDPEVRKKAEGMSVMPGFKDVVSAPGHDTSPGTVNVKQ